MPVNYPKKTEHNFIFLLTITFIILTIFVVKDIFALLVYSAIFAYFLTPLHNYFLKKVKKQNFSALLTLGTATGGIIAPIILLSYYLILSLIKLVVEYKHYIQNPELLNASVAEFIQKLTNSDVLSAFDYSDMLTTLVTFILTTTESFFSSIPKSIAYFFIMLFISYYILIHNKDIWKALNEYIPLSLKRQNELVKNITKNLKVLFRGYFLTGLIQTGVAMIGYLAFGVPNFLILSFLTLIISLIPYLGTPLIWVPVSLYLIVIGNEVSGIGLLIYGTLIISMVDNFVRPVLMSDKETISPPLVFVGFVGGMLAMGLQGLILGPIIISICSILLRYLQESYKTKS